MKSYSLTTSGNRWTVTIFSDNVFVTKRIFHVRPNNERDERIVKDYIESQGLVYNV